MASKIAEKAPSWFTRLLMPEIAEIKGELKNINTRIDSTNTRIDEMDKRLGSRIDSVNGRIDEMNERLGSKIDSVRNELKSEISRVDSRIEDLDKRLDIVQRLSVLEAKVIEVQEQKYICLLDQLRYLELMRCSILL